MCNINVKNNFRILGKHIITINKNVEKNLF